MRGVYPGTFNPPTIGHLAICEAAIEAHGLTSLDLVVSRNPLAKSLDGAPSLELRLEVIGSSVAHLHIVDVTLSEHRLIADIAEGYDLVIMGADKWHQINDPVFYDSHVHRDEALASLPRVAVAGRGDDPVPHHLRLEVPAHIAEISSTAVRAGATEWMTPEAAESGLWRP